MQVLSVLAVIFLPMTTFAETHDPSADLVTGAWASGESEDACDTAPITLFMSDGVVAVFLKKDGELHSLGAWSSTETSLTMTHNDFPLSGDGKSKSPVVLDIVEINSTQFVTRNENGQERRRIRCPDIKIGLSKDHSH